MAAAAEVQRISVYVVLPPRVLLLDVAGPIEVLRRANHEQAKVHFEVFYVAPAACVRSSIGLAVTGLPPLPARLPADAVVIVVGNVEEVMGISSRREAADEARQELVIVEWLRRSILPSHKLITICSGALFAGRAGLLDGRSCTTHFLDCERLALIAPSANLLKNRLYVRDQNVYSSAGITAGVDLMLYVVQELTELGCVLAVARYLVVYLRRSGSDPQLSPWLDGRNHIHPAIHRVQDAIGSDPTKTWTRTQLAKIAGASGRHLSRLFHEHTGMAIVEYRNRLRVAIAKELISQSQLDMEHVAERSGFESTRQLRRAWGRVFPTSPREARAPKRVRREYRADTLRVEG